jgi:glycosyltransferase involved in cell wall biosynthesis
MSPPDDLAEINRLCSELIDRGTCRVHVLAWRDLDDPDAGGSEVHADHFMRRWAAAGLDVLHRTSAARGLPATATRHGYDVVRRGSRYSVFPRTIAAELARRMGRYDALVEIWNGVPWFSPVWCRRPHVTFLHHVHGPMWDQIMPRPLAGLGRTLEMRLAPPFYRRTEVVTPSDATRLELLELGFRPRRVTTVNNGVDPFFVPGGQRAPQPTIIAAARLAPVKRLDLLLEIVERVRVRVPDTQLLIVGDGPERPRLDEWCRSRAADWVTFTGHLPREELRGLYQRAWLVASASLAEGWGLSITEGAGCGTPAVASNINGHRSSVVDGVTGILAEPAAMHDVIADLLLDDARLHELGRAALARARTLTWDASALGTLRVLHRVAMAHRRR